ncbi:WAP four-disulfide core domain protein 12-like [Anomaloglossus baeobatrachus]|uniref:WAP four-disulfide core domain protein 12-like n=1 Tax=Anomaloglossus baeobatrachus TaxID=238106 RepID=UPI003F508D50
MLFGRFPGIAVYLEPESSTMKHYLLLAFLLELTCIHGAEVTQSPGPADKPGLCPQERDLVLVSCTKKCFSDSECEGVRKCCTTSCNGAQCQMPYNKAGSCPAPEIVSGATCDEIKHCSSDNNCNGEQKCCNNACSGSSCQNPV